MLSNDCFIAHVYSWLIPIYWLWTTCHIDICMHCFIRKTVWHYGILLWIIYLNRLGTCSHMFIIQSKSQSKPRWFILPQSFSITFMPLLILFCRKYDYDGYALFVVASQSIASLHLYWAGMLLVHPKSLKPSYSKESTINSYAWYFTPFQVNFHVLPLKSSKYFSFCDTAF